MIGSNYLELSKNIQLYLRSINKDDHLSNNPQPGSDNSRNIWLREDSHWFFKIMNSIDNEVINLSIHCELVKELIDYL